MRINFTLLHYISPGMRSCFLWALLLMAATGRGQVATNYAFSQSTGAYTPITGGTLIVAATDPNPAGDDSAAMDDFTYSNIVLPFNFAFNGATYNRININSNGWISFGPVTTSVSTPISSGNAYSGVVAGFANDMMGSFGTTGTVTSGSNEITNVANTTYAVIGAPIRSGTNFPAGTTITGVLGNTITVSNNATGGATGTFITWARAEIRTETTGTAPDRVFTIQFSRLSEYAASAGAAANSDVNFQIMLHEGGGSLLGQTIDIVYGDIFKATGSETIQVGLRGMTNADFNNRTSSTDWAATTAGGINTSSITWSATVFPAPGQMFTWTPTTVVCPVPGSISVSNTMSTGTTVSFAGATTEYEIEYGTSSFTPGTGAGTVVVTSDNPYTITGMTPNPTGQSFFIRAICGPGDTSARSPRFVFVSNDNCADAFELTPAPGNTCATTFQGITQNASASGEIAPSCNAAGAGDDVWYSFTASSAGHLVRITAATNTTAAEVYSGSCGSLTPIAGACGSTSSGTVYVPASGLTIGQVYYVRVFSTSAVSSTSTNFDICIISPPANDECGGAISIVPSLTTTCASPVTGTTFAATSSTEVVPLCSTGGLNDDIWYSFMATATNHRVRITSTNGNTVAMQTYSGTCGALVPVASGCGSTSSATTGAFSNLTGLTIGETYYIRIWSTSTSVSTTTWAEFTLCVGTNPLVVNDECAGALPIIPALNAAPCNTVSVVTTGATQSAGNPGCTTSANNDDVWYMFLASNSDIVVSYSNLVLSGGTATTVGMSLYEGTCGALTEVPNTCSAGFGTATGGTRLIGGLNPGTLYYLRVYTGSANNDGSFDLCVKDTIPPVPSCTNNSAPANNATNITLLPTLTWAAATGATGYDVYIGPTSGGPVYTATVYNTTSYTVTTPLSSNTQYSFYVVPLNSAGMAAGCAANTTSFTTFTQAANDLPSGAIPVTVGASCSGNIYTTVSATSFPNEPFTTCRGTAGFNTVWYSFVAPPDGIVRVSTDFASGTGTQNDTRVAVYSATDVSDFSTFTILACDDDNGSLNANRSVVYVPDLIPGETYYVVVDNFSAGAGGTFCMEVQPVTSAMLAQGPGSCVGGQNVASVNDNYTGWLSLVDNGGLLIANVRRVTAAGTGTNTFGSAVTAITGTPRQSGAGTFYLNRNYLITGPATGVFDLQFFFQNAELTALQTSDPAANLADLNVTRQEGSTCQANFSGTNGPVALLTQTDNGAFTDISYVQVQTPAFSNFYIHAGVTPLKIVLADISAVNAGNRNRIDWSTQTEGLGDQFEIERSVDGRSFLRIGAVQAKGQPGAYSFWDEMPVAGINYYRLKLIDASGSFTYSKTVNATVADRGTFSLEVYPNPVHDQLTVRLYGQAGNNAIIQVSDVTGKVLRTVSIEGNQTTVDMSMLPSGLYLVKYSDGAHARTVKVNRQ